MNEPQAPMSMNQIMVEYWVRNQVAFSFHSMEPASAGKQRIIESLHLDRLNQFLNQNGFNLKPFTEHDLPRPAPESSPQPCFSDEEEELLETLVKRGIQTLGDEDDELSANLLSLLRKGRNQHSDEDNKGNDTGLNSLRGKYFFSPPEGEGTVVVSFFHSEATGGGSTGSGENGGSVGSAGSAGSAGQSGMTSSTMSSPSMNMPMAQEKGSLGMMGEGMDEYDKDDTATTVVNLVNLGMKNLQKNEVPVVGAMPNWLAGGTPSGTGCGTHGCPTSPPIPVSSNVSCTSAPGFWPITLPELPSSLLQSMTGDGVTVFVLDTVPLEGVVGNAATAAGANNLLLQDIASNVTFNRMRLPDTLDVPNPMQPSTGKDIYGRLVGFEMPDHGVFVAGIIRSIARKAKIECVRVLNDWSVGDVQTLTKALQDIQDRVTLPAGDLFQQPVVVNMSLVATPADEELVKGGFDKNTIEDLRKGMHLPIQILAQHGVVFLASAGNDSDTRPLSEDMSMASDDADPSDVPPDRFGPRYPAAFPEVIAVGAVDREGNAADYSNYPGPGGVATYGGGLPIPDPAAPFNPPPKPGSPECATEVTKVKNINDLDALIGVYTARTYPTLSIGDCQQEYNAPNSNAWAYWSGTSFATPIISALAARLLEMKARGQLTQSVHDAIIAAANQRTTQWTRLESKSTTTDNESADDETVPSPMILAVQTCQNTIT